MELELARFSVLPQKTTTVISTESLVSHNQPWKTLIFTSIMDTAVVTDIEDPSWVAYKGEDGHPTDGFI